MAALLWAMAMLQARHELDEVVEDTGNLRVEMQHVRHHTSNSAEANLVHAQ